MRFYTLVASEVTNKTLNASAYEFEKILASIYPITFSCYNSVFEFKDAFLSYLATFDAWDRVLYNIMHKVGIIYDTIWYLVYHHGH